MLDSGRECRYPPMTNEWRVAGESRERSGALGSGAVAFGVSGPDGSDADPRGPNGDSRTPARTYSTRKDEM